MDKKNQKTFDLYCKYKYMYQIHGYHVFDVKIEAEILDVVASLFQIQSTVKYF